MPDMKPGFYIESAGRLDDLRKRMKPNADLADIEQTMSEIVARQSTVRTRKKRAPVAVAAQAKGVDWTKPVRFDAKVDEAEIRRRLGR
jgi:hypothetical protein